VSFSKAEPKNSIHTKSEDGLRTLCRGCVTWDGGRRAKWRRAGQLKVTVKAGIKVSLAVQEAVWLATARIRREN